MSEPANEHEIDSLGDIPQGEANLKLVRRWLATILMRIETLIEIEESEREKTDLK